MAGSAAQAAVITTDSGGFATGVQGLVVNGQAYDVVFASPATDSFSSLWDPNNDGDYSDSTTGHAPTFINNKPLALEATSQIVAALGTTYRLPYSFPGGAGQSDSVVVPFERYQGSNSLYAVKFRYDSSHTMGGDSVNVSTLAVTGLFKNSDKQSAYAIFNVVPEPGSAAALLGLAVLVVGRRRR